MLKLDDQLQATVVIPAYNEAGRIGRVIESVKEADLVGEIIVMDNASGDKTAEAAASFPGVRVITNQTNLGKTRSVLKGVRRASNEVVLLVDADLEGLAAADVDNLIRPVIEGRADMSISYRAGQPFFNKYLLWACPYVSGERCFRKEDFTRIDDLEKAKGYQVEMLTNRDYLNNRRRIAVVTFQKVRDDFKFQKSGFWLGWWRDLQMSWGLLSAIGFWEILRQVLLISVRYQWLRRFGRQSRDEVIL